MLSATICEINTMITIGDFCQSNKQQLEILTAHRVSSIFELTANIFSLTRAKISEPTQRYCAS